jgi:myo-inositol 2-dehydrogenase / D-chiro-inositol 1-dehydrogenase
MRPLKLCVVGCGEHAVSSHGPSQARYAHAHHDVTLAACCDVAPDRARAYAERFGFARSYGDVSEMLTAEIPDAAVLIVPDGVTAELACAILERGIPLLLEKPPGRDVRDVDRMLAAARKGVGGTGPVPHQVAFNRRYVPLLRELRARIEGLGPGALQHMRYEMVRVDRRDRDFSTTAIHGIDTVRFLAGSDYAEARFRYQELPELGAGIANIFMDAVLTSGATAHLAFCPVAGVVVERVEAHAHGHTYFGEVPMWGAFDAPGRLQHLSGGVLREELRGDATRASFEQGGFFDETAAFFDDLRAGRAPSPDLAAVRQSMAVAEAIRERRSEYRP